MAQLGLVASDIYDAYFQDLAPANTVFTPESFKDFVVQEYAKLLQTEYERQKLINKAQTGYSVVEISPEFLLEEEVKTERDREQGIWVAKLKNNVYSFNFDAMSTGVQYIEYKVGSERRQARKASYTDRWQAARVPFTQAIFAYIKKGNTIEFLNGNPGEVKVQYIPALDATKDDCYISDSFVPTIKANILNIQFFAKNGLPVDMTNDQNKNATIQTEVNKDSLKNT